MIIRRTTLESVLPAVQAKDDTHRLDRIEIRPDGSVTATDGHVLLSATEHTRFPDEDFPQAGVPHYTGDAKTPILIPAPEVRQLLKIAQTEGKRRTLPILCAIQIGMNGDGNAHAAATDLQASTSVRVHGPDKAQGGPFPAWDKGIIPPADRPALELCMSSEVLRALADAADKAQSAVKEAKGTVTIYVPTEPQWQGSRTDEGGDKVPDGKVISALRVEIRGREVKIIGAAMPCRI